MGKGGEQVKSNNRKISVEELREHGTPGDAWVSYRNKVYDVSNWNDHPGGSVIFTHAGDDCTDVFAAFHPPSASSWLEKFEIGDLDDTKNITLNQPLNKNKRPPAEQKKFEKAYRELRAKMFTMGLFNASIGFYVYKVLSNLLLLFISVGCVTLSSSLVVHMIGAVSLGLFWQQCGWLAHDFLHHQVFKTRVYNDMMGILVGNVFQGFSIHWWKNKHNSHHAVPNLEASCADSADGDPDIDTMPILAWTISMAKLAEKSNIGRTLIKFQAFFYFPVLLFARMAWAHQSWVYVFGGWGSHSIKQAENDRARIQYPMLEKSGLVLHYLGLFAILACLPSISSMILFFIVSQTSCGLFLATVFGLGHNGMAVYPAAERPDFWKLQVTTTRNISSNWFVDWFCGGLQYQVDHHLFPMVPRHHLKEAHKLVTAFCQENNVDYYETDMWTGTIEILNHLSKISVEFATEFPAM